MRALSLIQATVTSQVPAITASVTAKASP